MMRMANAGRKFEVAEFGLREPLAMVYLHGVPRESAQPLVLRPPTFATASLPDEPWTTRLLTTLGSGLDSVVLRAMRMVVDAAIAPPPDQIPILRAAAAPYLADELQRTPEQFFAFLTNAQDRIPVQISERFTRQLDRGAIVSRIFLSGYQRFYDDQSPPCVENERIPVQHWMHEPGTAKGTIIALHGFSMGQPRLDAFGMMAADWYKRGLDVALMTLPYHGARAPHTARFSGELFASPDVGHLNEAVRQAVSDAHMLVNWFRKETKAPVGLLGLSLGGYISSLMAGLVDDLDFVIPMVPPVDLADLAWRFFIQSGGNAPRPPLDREEHFAAYRLHSPLTYERRVPKEKLLIVAGRGDLVVPVEHPYALWQHWEQPAVYWYSGSHIAPFRRGLIVNEVASHLRGLGIL